MPRPGNHPSPALSRRMRHAAALLLLGAALLGLRDAAAQDSIKEARAAREEARERAAAAAAQLDVLKAQDAELAAVLADLEEAIAGQQALVTEATVKLQAAEDEARQRAEDHRRAEQELVRLREQLTELAVDAYIERSLDPSIDLFLAREDVNESMRRAALFEQVAGDRVDLLDRIRALEVDSEIAAEDAAAARDEARSLRSQLEEALEDLRAQQADQERLRAELKARQARWEAEQKEFEAEEAAMTELIKELQADLLAQWNPELSRESIEGFIMPTKAQIGSGFGPRTHPIYGYKRMHNGVDMGAPSGQAIVAAKAGRVIYAGPRGGYGNVVLIEHEGGVVTLYAHQSEILVSKGERVGRGEVIGKVGSTGLSTGPHLHFEVRVGGIPRDPLLFLPS